MRDKLVSISTEEKMSLADLAEKICNNVYIEDDAANFIALLTDEYQSWELKEVLIRHFKAVEIKYNEVFKEDEREDLSPKLIQTT